MTLYCGIDLHSNNSQGPANAQNGGQESGGQQVGEGVLSHAHPP